MNPKNKRVIKTVNISYVRSVSITNTNALYEVNNIINFEVEKFILQKKTQGSNIFSNIPFY